MGLLAGALNAYGTYTDSRTEAAAQDRNALTSELAAGDSLQRGAQQVGLARMMATRAQGEQRAAIGASGVDGSSPMELLADTRMISELDARTLQNNAAREAWGYRVQAAESRYGAERTRRRGEVGAASSLLGGFASAINQFAGAMTGGV